MITPEIRNISFKDIANLPEVHTDERRTIYETIAKTPQGSHRISRSVVNADEVVLGNHWHDFNQEFSGKGEGILYTAPKDDLTNVTEQMLPAQGWAFTLPAGTAMALKLKKGAIHIFESDKHYQDGANTHRVILVS